VLRPTNGVYEFRPNRALQTRGRQFHKHLKKTCYCDHVKKSTFKMHHVHTVYVVSHTKSATEQILLNKKCGAA